MKKSATTIVYLDTENTNMDGKIKAFRNAYDIEFVPTLICFHEEGFKKFEFTLTFSNYSQEDIREKMLTHFAKLHT